jgi:hypothetical protein
MQPIGEPLQVFATVIEHLTHHAFPALHEDHVCMGAGKAFVGGIREHIVTCYTMQKLCFHHAEESRSEPSQQKGGMFILCCSATVGYTRYVISITIERTFSGGCTIEGYIYKELECLRVSLKK